MPLTLGAIRWTPQRRCVASYYMKTARRNPACLVQASKGCSTCEPTLRRPWPLPRDTFPPLVRRPAKRS